MKRSIICIALASTIVAGTQKLTFAQNADSVSLKDHPGWIQIPGAIIRQDCVYEIPNGAQVSETGDVTLEWNAHSPLRRLFGRTYPDASTSRRRCRHI